MTKFFAFLKDEAGAVTVDWVVLTAAIVGLGLLIFNFVRPAVSNLAEGIGNALITTAAGLVVAIPALIMYNYLISRVENMVVEMEMSSTELIELLTRHRGEREI